MLIKKLKFSLNPIKKVASKVEVRGWVVGLGQVKKKTRRTQLDSLDKNCISAGNKTTSKAIIIFLSLREGSVAAQFNPKYIGIFYILSNNQVNLLLNRVIVPRNLEVVFGHLNNP